MYLCARELLNTSILEKGLVRVARLGRYGQVEEREAALLLDAFRSGTLNVRAQVLLSPAPETMTILQLLDAPTRRKQFDNVIGMGHISAARVLLCDCADRSVSREDQREARAITAKLIKWLPLEATDSVRTGALESADIRSLFAPRVAEINFI